jgi:hypothetical protein
MASRNDDSELPHQCGFRGIECGGTCRALQLDGDQVLFGIGPDMGHPIGEIISA